jgi:putative ABC transport system permease protein
MSLVEECFRGAPRALRRSPGFTLAVVLTLALTVGANTAMFTVVEAVLLRSLPYPRSGELVSLKLAFTNGVIAEPLLTERAAWATSQSLSSLATYDPEEVSVRGRSTTDYVAGGWATASLLEVLGVRPALGRWFAPNDEPQTAPRVAVLSHRLWQRQFGGDHGALGETVWIMDQPFTVIGVLPPKPDLPLRADIWFAAARRQTGETIARLRPGVSPIAAQRELERLSPDIERVSAGRPPLRYRGHPPSRPPLWVGAASSALATRRGVVPPSHCVREHYKPIAGASP